MTTAGANSNNNKLDEYVVNNIDAAIENGWIKVYYQPVIRSLTGKLCGAESLARWIDPEFGFLAPDKFISALEASSQIHKLDCFIVDRVCHDIADRINANLSAVPVSVNFSRLDFETTDMLKVVEDAVEKYDIPRDYIHIEITESMIVSDSELMTSVIDNFRNAGYEVWMDDFGSGYSSLTLLKDYTFDTLKLDMNFLSNLNDKTKAIITSTVTMAKNIDIKTLAEGVETRQQIEFLRDIGCGRLQGYYYGKPMPLNEFFTHMKQFGIDMEHRQWRHYYEVASFKARATDEPLELLEDNGRDFKTLFMNEPYKRQIFENDHSLEEIDKLIYHTASPLIKKYRQFADLLKQTRSRETLYYTTNGNILCFQAQVVAENAGHCIIEGSIRNLSSDIALSKRNSLDFRLKELNHLFEMVLQLNPSADKVTPLLGKFLYVTEFNAHNISLKDRFGAFVRNHVAVEDTERFLSFMDLDSISERIQESVSGYIEDIFRLKQMNGNYEWKEVALMIIPGTGGGEFLFCIKSIPAALNDFIAPDSEYIKAKGIIDTSKDVRIDPQMWDNIVNHTTIKFFWKDTDRRFLGASRSFLEYYGFSSVDAIRGKTDEDMAWHIDEKTYQDDEESIINEGAHIYNVPTQCIINGTVHSIVCNKMPIYKNGKIIGLMGYFVDVDEELSRIDALYNARRSDSVTGLMNTKALTDSMIDYAFQYNERQRDFGLIILKDQNYKRIVGSYGQDFADKLLKKMGQEILTVTGTSCAVGRTFDSTFALITHTSDISELKYLADKVKKALESIKELDGNPVTIRIKYAMRMRSDEGTTDESMYFQVQNQLEEDV